MQMDFFASLPKTSAKQCDRAERHGFEPRLWLLFSPFLFPSKKRGNKKRRRNIKNMIKIPAFLLDQQCQKMHC